MSEIVALGGVGLDPSARSMETAYAVKVLDPARADQTAQTGAASASFGSLIGEGLAQMDAKVVHADRMVMQFALDENTPVHQVTIALEEARLAVEMTMQVRQRLLEGYRELMNLQL